MPAHAGFPPGTLSIVTVAGAVTPPFEWQVGQMDTGNLGGTITGLDNSVGAALSGSISTILTVLSWICVGIHSRRVLPSPVCA